MRRKRGGVGEEEEEKKEEEEEGTTIVSTGVEYYSHTLTSDTDSCGSITLVGKIINTTDYINTSLNSHITGVCSWLSC